MATKSSIMDTNSYTDATGHLLDGQTYELVQRRQKYMGGAYRLFYRKPVNLVRGEGEYLWDANGTKYLDMYNNVAGIGHCHPAVVEAVTGQMQQLNTHTRYLHERIVDYSEEILELLPDEIDKIMYMCTGSEANDLALRMAAEYTGGKGIIVSQEAYHGTSALTSGCSPALGSEQPLLPNVRLICTPDYYRQGGTPEEFTAWYAGEMQKKIDELQAAGYPLSCFLADSIFSSDGVHPNPVGFLKAAIDVVHKNGGVFIADEVQPGFARTGDSFWGFARHGIVPDLVTMGKPMGNGIPVSGLAARHEEQLQEHCRIVGGKLLTARNEVKARHPESVGDVRGAGLFIGFELVKNDGKKTPDQAKALDLIELLRDHQVLTSVAGHYGNVLKLRPPMAFQECDIDWIASALDQCLSITEE